MRSKITAIKANKNFRIQRSNIYLDGKFSFSLDNEVIVKEALKVGRELSPSELELLTQSDSFHRCLNAAFQFLSYRPRSESEVRVRLAQRGFGDIEIEKVVAQLKRLALIDDTSFAEFWKENRSAFRPRSGRMLTLELRRKGVESAVINAVVENSDDVENAFRAARSKARTLAASDYPVFRHRLSGYLQRRGFSYGVINSVVKQVWQERTGITFEDPDNAAEIGAAD